MLILVARRVGGQAGDVDLVVEVADVGHDRLVLHPAHLISSDHIPTAGRGDVDISDVQHLLSLAT